MISILPDLKELAGYELKVLCEQYKRGLMDRKHFIQEFKLWKERNGIGVIFDCYCN